MCAIELVLGPASLPAQAGESRIVVRSTGAVEHDFVTERVPGLTGNGIPSIAPGATGQLSVDLQPGSYAMVGTLPGIGRPGR